MELMLYSHSHIQNVSRSIVYLIHLSSFLGASSLLSRWMPVRTCSPSLSWAGKMSWLLSEEMIFTKIQVRGSGPCLLPVLDATTFPD